MHVRAWYRTPGTGDVEREGVMGVFDEGRVCVASGWRRHH